MVWRPKSMMEKHPLAKKIAANITWLFFDKILRMGAGLFVVVWLARYLGPEQFGVLNFAVALVTVFGAIAALGLTGIVVRDLVNRPQLAPQTLGTAFALKLTAASLSYAVLILAISLLRPDDTVSKLLVAIYGASLFFKSTEVVKYWFESQVRSKYVVLVENATFLFISLLKLFLLWQQAPLVAFAYVMLLESIIVATALLLVYARIEANPFRWGISKDRAVSLLHDSWPLIISSAAWILYTRLDQIMIGRMLDDQSVGYYTAATRISDVVNFIPTVIAFSIIPAITKLRQTDRQLYLKRFQTTYDITVGNVLVVAIATAFLSEWIIRLLFGAPYAAAAPVLTIHIWSAVFIAMATVSGRFLINEGLQRITMQRHLLGLLLNFFLNLVMIPRYGIQGAAMATLLSLALANYFFDALTPSTVICFKQKTKAVLLVTLLKHALKRAKK